MEIEKGKLNDDKDLDEFEKLEEELEEEKDKNEEKNKDKLEKDLTFCRSWASWIFNWKKK